MERLKSITRPRRQYNLIGGADNRREIEGIPLFRTNKKSQRKIYERSGLRMFPTSLFRFGPVYYGLASSESAKEEAWKQVLRNSSADEDEEVMDVYLSAIRRVEKKARAAYTDETLERVTETEFRWLMIKDGCLFLQLALFILGASKELGYPENHIIFGNKNGEKVFNRWIKSMFYAGNQIPLVVLNDLMKHTFFQNVITKHEKWERPMDMLSKGILYDLLIMPARAYAASQVHDTSKEPGSTFILEEQPSDLLHGLQNLVLGSSLSRNDSNEEEDEEDEEEGHDLESGGSTLNNGKVSGDSDGKEHCVSNFVKKGIFFWKSKKTGISGNIQFKNNVLYAGLYIPAIPLNRDTDVLFENLKYYEECQQQNEVRSYLGVMNQLISTYEDVNHLASQGIFQVSNPHYKEKFLKMLKKICVKKTATNHDHRYVLQQLRDHPAFPWEYFKYLAIFASVFTLLQTIFGVLSYVVGKQQLDRS